MGSLGYIWGIVVCCNWMALLLFGIGVVLKGI